MAKAVTVALTADEALMLHLASQQEADVLKNFAGEDPFTPEQFVLSRVHGMLHEQLEAPLLPNYSRLLADAQRRVLKKHTG